MIHTMNKERYQNIQKGIYFNISETALESSSKIVERDANFDTTFNPRDTRSSKEFNIRYNSSKENTKTESLIKLLQFDKINNKPYTQKIGQMANKKVVSEAVVIIPYFDEEMYVKVVPEKTNTSDLRASKKTNISTAPSHKIDMGDDILFGTREIIPGKHFLALHEKTFENILNVLLTYKLYDNQSTKFLNLIKSFATPMAGMGTVSTLEAARATDAGKMVEHLIGGIEDVNNRGFQLPPEFDFVHNKAVKPFQMIILPFEEQFDKVDLMDIYQGVMPKSSLSADKVASSFTLNTNINPPDPNIVPSMKIGKKRFSMAGMYTTSFLNPSALTKKTTNQFNIRGISTVDQNTDSIEDFYSKIKFMVFKIKQRSQSNYERYRKRELSKLVKSQMSHDYGTEFKIENMLDQNQYSAEELYGMNWPYDYFSLIEMVKINLKMKL
jgi:hypothetical protein